jgi:hypothetical protein
MEDFVVVDLSAQREAVYRHVKGRSKAEILAWLSQYAEIRYLEKFDTYAFCSKIHNRHTAFRFTDEGELIVLR